MTPARITLGLVLAVVMMNCVLSLNSERCALTRNKAVHPDIRGLSEKSSPHALRASVVEFFLGISTRRHGDRGVYTERSDFSDRLH